VYDFSDDFDITLFETDEETGEAIYFHSPDCPSYCDYACNGREGRLMADAYNAGLYKVKPVSE
jgi:hypothetical protein